DGSRVPSARSRHGVPVLVWRHGPGAAAYRPSPVRGQLRHPGAVASGPRPAGHVPEMIAMIRRLIERGHASPADGNVYFDVRSYPSYGELSGQRLDQMRPADDSSGAGKRD